MDRTGRIVVILCMLAMGALFYFYPATIIKPVPPATNRPSAVRLA
jgi:hypothetical protein